MNPANDVVGHMLDELPDARSLEDIQYHDNPFAVRQDGNEWRAGPSNGSSMP